MIGAAQLDSFAVMGVAAVLVLVLAVALRSRPRAALVFWMLTLCFIPYWMGITVLAYLPPATALACVLVVSIPIPAWARIRGADVVVLLFLALVGIGYLTGYVDLNATFVALVEWGTGYLVGRLIAELLELDVIYIIFSSIVAVAAALAVIEFVTTWNPFVHFFSSGPTFDVWGSLQERGGLIRAEGAFGHSIALGATCAMAVPLAIGSSMRQGWKIAVTVALCSGALVTLSRIGIVSSFLGLVLCVLFLRTGLSTRAKAWITFLVVVATAAALPQLTSVFESAGDEASDSAEYRGQLTSLIPSMRLMGVSGAMSKSVDGTVRWGNFKSIDSALILGGLEYGIIPVVLLMVGLVLAVVLVLRGHANPPTIALVAQIPALVSVALITQYAAAFWFMAGLAVVATAEGARDRARAKDAVGAAPAPVRSDAAWVTSPARPVEET